jgi:putative ABC transport system permease protein
MSSVAAVALLLAVAGIYGVTSFIVSLRRHEIGIRMALGAQISNIVRMILGRGLILAGIGMAIGLAASLALSRFLASLLYGISATDVASYAAGALLLFATAAAACYLPARRAARIDPLATLREE